MYNFKNLISQFGKVFPFFHLSREVETQTPVMSKFPNFTREFKFTNQVDNSRVYMLLNEGIGSSKNPRSIIGSVFAEEMYFWHGQNKKITVKINCPGGGVIDAFSIIDAIKTTGADTENTGIAASAAMLILCAGAHRSAGSHTKGMIHGPKGEDKVLENLMRDSLTTLLKDGSNYPQAEIENMVKAGAPDVWLSAKEMKEKGLIDEVINSRHKVEASVTDPYALYEVYNSLTENQMPEEQKGDVNKAYAEILASLTTAQSEKTSALAEIADLKAKLKAKEDADKAKIDGEAKTIVEAAIKAKQLPEAKKDQFIKMAVADLDGFKAMLETTKPVDRKSVVASMKLDTTPDDKKNYRWYEDNDVTALMEMMDNEPEKYNRLVNEYNDSFKKQA